MAKAATTFEAKHLFLDIVSYTHNRSIEAQTDLIAILNKIVKKSVRKSRINNENIIYIPTGDGMCITLMNISKPYDIHLIIALEILSSIEAHNKSIEDEMRKFSIRIGINENIDNLVTDINKQKNVSGSGINFAARTLSLCDSNQILVSSTVFDRLVQREKYINSFQNYTGEVKHGVRLSVYQYRNESLSFLNSDTPALFRKRVKSSLEFNDLVAYYIANCIVHEDFVSKNIDSTKAPYTLTYIMFHLAQDCIARSKTTKLNPNPNLKTKRPIQDEFNYFQSLDFWLLADLDSYVSDKLSLYTYSEYFSDGYLFVNEKGRSKLMTEHYSICQELEIK